MLLRLSIVIITLAVTVLLSPGPSLLNAKDTLLTIGGGYARSGNQASLEKNVLYFQRALQEQGLGRLPHTIYFADGLNSGRDLQVMDRDSVPKANRLMSEFFGDTDDLGLSYRDHQVQGVRGSTRPENIRKWFATDGRQLKRGDRLVVYVTSHGNQSSDRRDPYNTTIATWDNTSIKMKEFVQMLDGLADGVEVVVIMVQCHAGGFARFIFNEGDPDKGLSKQRRSGFFATVHDRNAAGCTPEIDEANYVEYSTYFWAAIAGRDRSGRAIDRPDYDGDGDISFDEAHAYVILTADTIDLPVKSSGEYLTVHSKFGDGDDSKLLPNDIPYEKLLALATPVQKAILEGLSEQLDLNGSDRLVDAWKETKSDRDRAQPFARSPSGIATGSAAHADQRRPKESLAGTRECAQSDLQSNWSPPAAVNSSKRSRAILNTTATDNWNGNPRRPPTKPNEWSSSIASCASLTMSSSEKICDA